jgi:hypothetical protein
MNDTNHDQLNDLHCETDLCTERQHSKNVRHVYAQAGKRILRTRQTEMLAYINFFVHLVDIRMGMRSCSQHTTALM